MLIRNAEIRDSPGRDLRIEGARIAAVGTLAPHPGETVIDAKGGLLLPGLHDHHIHLAGLAARQASVSCGPPAVRDADELARALQVPGSGWLRAIDFHESVLGGALPDAAMLDSLVPQRPLRLQHRTGRMWLLNTPALDALLAMAPPPPGLEREGGRFTGRLFDEDAWLRTTLGSVPPDFAQVAARLAGLGVTGLTDMSPGNDAPIARHFAQQRAAGRLPQSIVLAGSPDLAGADPKGWQLGPVKLHLHESALPDFDEALALVRAARTQERCVAVHCVTEVELVFTVALLEAAGAMPGDRIEHASIASADMVVRMRALGLAVCVQPHFIAQRGDRYLAEVEPRHHGDLYRLRSLRDAGVVLCGGSDAPYGEPDPWKSMAAAVSRRAPNGIVIGADEALSPEDALALYLADPLDLARQRRIVPGAPADLCLLDRPWREARARLLGNDVRLVIAGGALVHQRVDEPPFERPLRADTAA
ncbi:amidohydrolase family protein [Novosphingobium resinovorum]|uniref:amidohydrolase family protein n=1 Tax=Novosphingobium resinovorum TaxID=158500 RepID=UPI002ED31646|nr:amidohydrolase family protein [Novosphingobium resinovorum]